MMCSMKSLLVKRLQSGVCMEQGTWYTHLSRVLAVPAAVPVALPRVDLSRAYHIQAQDA
jgi:hypothetical protein